MWRGRLKLLAVLLAGAGIGAAATAIWSRDAADGLGLSDPTPEVWREYGNGLVLANVGPWVEHSIGFRYGIPEAVLQVHRQSGTETMGLTRYTTDRPGATRQPLRNLVGAVRVTLVEKDGRRVYGLAASVPASFRFPNGDCPGVMMASPAVMDRFQTEHPAPGSLDVGKGRVEPGDGVLPFMADQPQLVVDETQRDDGGLIRVRLWMWLRDGGRPGTRPGRS